MSHTSEPSEDRAVASPSAELPPLSDYEWRERRARISAARGLVEIHQRFGGPISDEVLALAAEDYNARRPPPQEPRTAAEVDAARREHRVRISAARGLVEIHQRFGGPISDDVRALAAEEY
ncbi:MAG: hypothetical protein JO144_13530 [Actinobacteria bacterium]|nr:hypothetical protein [Actinomycetota bacterium]